MSLPEAPTGPLFPKAPTRDPKFSQEAEDRLLGIIKESADFVNSHNKCMKCRSMTAEEFAAKTRKASEYRKLYEDSMASWKQKGLGGSRRKKRRSRRRR